MRFLFICGELFQFLDEERFRAVDKIKTVGSTYMAAVGLIPEMRIQENDHSAGLYMTQLVELAFAFRDTVDIINKDSYNNFSLRVGKKCRFMHKHTCPFINIAFLINF